MTITEMDFIDSETVRNDFIKTWTTHLCNRFRDIVKAKLDKVESDINNIDKYERAEAMSTWLSELRVEIADLIKYEISEIDGTIKNEELVLLGSSTDHDFDMHENNILAYKEYLELLQNMLSGFESASV